MRPAGGFAFAPRVAVVGPADAGPELLDAAYDVGAGLARLGVVLVTGGLGGVMEAACRGAYGSGGQTVGLLPGTDPTEANQFVTLPVPTGLGQARNVLVVRTAQVVVAVGGSWGTCSEVAFACRVGRPVVWLSGWRVTDEHGEPPAGGPVPAPGVDETIELVGRLLSALRDPAG